MTDKWKRVRELLSRATLPPGEPLPAGISSKRQAELDNLLGGRTPRELAELLQISNGPCVGAGGLFGYKTIRENQDFEYYWSFCPEWRRNGWIPVGGDGCGNSFVLISSAGVERLEPVIFVDTMEDTASASYIVASSLRLFCEFYLEADQGERRWPFNRSHVVGRDPQILECRGVELPWDK